MVAKFCVREENFNDSQRPDAPFTFYLRSLFSHSHRFNLTEFVMPKQFIFVLQIKIKMDLVQAELIIFNMINKIKSTKLD